MGRNSRGYAVAGVDRLAKSGPVLRCILAGHGTDAQMVEAFFGHGQADQAASVPGHAVNRFGSDFFCCDGKIAFLLAVSSATHTAHPPAPTPFVLRACTS